MKILPIGVQSFTKLRERNCVYVDKTQLVHQLVTNGSYYFFSRPRRFGKSLLISTLKELYLGNQAVFEGLWIEPHWDWSKKHPVIHISFDAVDYVGLGLAAGLMEELDRCAKKYSVSLEKQTPKSKFMELVDALHAQYGKVVLLIDEYDKPIIDFLETEALEQAKANREVLREFYGVLKNADSQLELVFITGISKFSKVSLFSHLNNLKDITLVPQYATIAGYTQEELEFYFDDYLQRCQTTLQLSREKLLDHMKIWYDGYSWDGITELYNPFGTLNFLDDQQFRNYWFSTGSPSFLIKKMRSLTFYNVENTQTNTLILDKYDLENIDLVPLLFQTGYLTVKKIDPMTGDMVLDYPNKEVRESMYVFLIDDLSRNQQRTHTGMTIADMSRAFVAKDLKKVRNILDALLADLPSEVFLKQTEGLYHGLVHLVFSYLGQMIQSEVHSSRGHADAVVQTPTDVYIFEFKFNKTAKEALDQIKTNDYVGKYRASGRAITAIGVNFNAQERTIDGWEEAPL
jgi:Predicted AAA-ATPase/PD-(D/E)XK nuclease superfamily